MSCGRYCRCCWGHDRGRGPWLVAMVVRGGDRGHGDGRCDSGGSDGAMAG